LLVEPHCSPESSTPAPAAGPPRVWLHAAGTRQKLRTATLRPTIQRDCGFFATRQSSDWWEGADTVGGRGFDQPRNIHGRIGVRTRPSGTHFAALCPAYGQRPASTGDKHSVSGPARGLGLNHTAKMLAALFRQICATPTAQQSLRLNSTQGPETRRSADPARSNPDIHSAKRPRSHTEY